MWYVQVVVPVSHCKDTHNFDKTNNFPKNICLILSNLGKIGDNKGQNLNIFLKSRGKNGLKSGRLPAFWRVHLGRLSRVQDLTEVGCGPLVVCSVLLSALSLCLWRVACKYGSISHFEGVFSVVWGVCVGLCCLGALRGLWGFVRVWS